LGGIDVNPTVGTSGHADQADPATRPYRKTRPRTEPAVYVATPSFDGAHWDETERAKDKPTIQHTFETLNVDGQNGKRLLDGTTTARSRSTTVAPVSFTTARSRSATPTS